MGNDFYLIKFFDEKYRESMLSGQLHFSYLPKFTDDVDGLTEAQADSSEGKSIDNFNSECEKVFMRLGGKGEPVRVDFSSANITQKIRQPETYYICSFVMLYPNKDFDDNGNIKDDFIKSVSDIANGRPFILVTPQSLDSNLAYFASNTENNIRAWAGQVKYTDEPFKGENGLNLLFQKRTKYSNQREYRAVIHGPVRSRRGIDIEQINQPIGVFNYDELNTISIKWVL